MTSEPACGGYVQYIPSSATIAAHGQLAVQVGDHQTALAFATMSPTLPSHTLRCFSLTLLFYIAPRARKSLLQWLALAEGYHGGMHLVMLCYQIRHSQTAIGPALIGA